MRNVFLPPTALKLMRAEPARKTAGRLAPAHASASGGETLGAELLDWGRATLGVAINEFYGQTECNMIVVLLRQLMPVAAGLMGRPVPGHEVAVIDERGSRVRRRRDSA